MRSATKVLLETIQVTRHVGQLGLRPLEKAARQAAQAGEELTFWTLKLQPLEELLGRSRTKQLLDSYLQAKEVVGESVASLSHQSWMSTLQSGAQAATFGLQKAGLQTRVVGPFDEHWNTLKVLKDLRSAAAEQAARSGSAAFKLTPKRFVQFMREAERRKRRARRRDPVEDYVEWLLRSGSLSSMGAVFFEKKLYTDVARILCYAFDRALMEANGADIWGHELHIKVGREAEEAYEAAPPRTRSMVGVEQVEAVVDLMLKSQDLRAPPGMAGVQRQLLMNCSVMILQLIEDLTSDRHMQVSLLGHSLRIRLEPLPLEQLLREDKEDGEAQRFRVNTKAVDELVDALIEEPEVQLVLVPDLLEAEVYRYALHRMICIAQFILAKLRIRLFGMDVSLDLFANEETVGVAVDDAARAQVLQVSPGELQGLLNRLEEERRCIEHELHARRGEHEAVLQHEAPGSGQEVEEEVDHLFHTMSAQDRLSRSLDIQRTVSVPIDLAFRMVSEVNEYPKWMPFCTSARILRAEEGDRTIHCEVGFGLETGTALGMVGDTVRYRVSLSEPREPTAPPQSPQQQQQQQQQQQLRRPPPSEGGAEVHQLREARVVADTADGFRYGKRLVYDWRFVEVSPGETDVRLDMFFQARSVFFLPLWDSMQATVTSVMMKKFIERADALSGGGPSGSDGSAAPASAGRESTP